MRSWGRIAQYVPTLLFATTYFFLILNYKQVQRFMLILGDVVPFQASHKATVCPPYFLPCQFLFSSFLQKKFCQHAFGLP